MRNVLLRNILLCVLIVFFASCSSVQETNDGGLSPVYLTNKAAYTLLPPSALETPLDGTQQISGSYGNRSFIMDAFVMADADGMSLFLFDSFGTEAAALSFTGEAITFESAFFPKTVKPEYIAADFQLVFYQADAVEQALRSCGLGFVAEKKEDAAIFETRQVTDGGKLIIEIEKGQSEIRYRNFLRNYSYTLQGNF